MFIILYISFNDGTNLNIFPIKVAYYCISLKNGGIERVMSLLANYLSKDKRFKHYLITADYKSERDYSINQDIIRLSLSEKKISILEAVKANNIDILIYNYYDKLEISVLNKLRSTKLICYDHSSYFFWIYQNIYNFKDSFYYEYKNCHYVISLIPLENDFLFKKWGINSILMDNPSTFEYNLVKPSDLIQKNIIMIGRANDIFKRFDLGIKAMKSIIKEIPKCKMNILSFPEKNLEILIHNLNLQKCVKFVGYHTNIDIFLKNSSLHILPSISEAYPMVLSETKIFGIPSIIIGLDYITLAKKGTVIIYDDDPNAIAKEAIKILKNDEYRKKLGKEARKSMKIHKNSIIAQKWTKLLLSVYKGKESNFMKRLKVLKAISEIEAEKILKNQLILLQKRIPILRNLTFEKLINFSLL